MLRGIKVLAAVAGVALIASAATGEAQTVRNGGSHSRSSPVLRSIPSVRRVIRVPRAGIHVVHRPSRFFRPHRFVRHMVGGLVQGIVEDVLESAIETAITEPVQIEEAAPLDLSELAVYGVPPSARPEMYALLTSPDEAQVAQGEMFLMDYQLNLQAEQDGLLAAEIRQDQQRRRRDAR
jgi:hypothetical protein